MSELLCPSCRKIISEHKEEIDDEYISCPYCGQIFTKEECGL